MTERTIKQAILAGVAASALVAAPAASADLITNWNYTVDSGFSEVTADGGDGTVRESQPNADFDNKSTRLDWGSDSDGDPVSEPSSLEVEKTLTGSLTLGTDVNGTTLTHDNRPIPAASSMLDEFDTDTRFKLSSGPPENAEKELTQSFSSFFTETRNEDVLSDCLAASESRCDDIFVLRSDGAGIPDGVRDSSFIVDGYRYTASLDLMSGPNGLSLLTDAQCRKADTSAGCIGFVTQEDQENTFTPTFQVTAEKVPSPGSVALLGLGLVGLGFGRRYGRARG